ncbi:MAG TPA: phosphopantothenoylcysteine decarboxylase [Opitutaceae bacterium]|nr:phosphopantothenoylcysteine decarboxylase [Opitutaceae bacterium]
MKPLRCLITAGPTREHLDPIRYLSNASSGKMGYALASEAVARGWIVDLVSGPVSLDRPAGVNVLGVTSAQEMYEACRGIFTTCDLFIAVAAVADFRPKMISPTKIKKSGAATQLELEPTIDVLRTLAATKTPGQICVGFAAETNDLENYARRKLVEKNLDWVVANDVSRPGIGMNADPNEVVLLNRAGQRFAFGPAVKSAVAKFIFNTIVPPCP